MHFKQLFENQSLKNQNLKELYRLIHQHGPVKKTDLLELTNSTQTTLVRMIDELLKLGLIYESGMEKSSGGRPPILYQIVSDSNYVVGIDISRTRTIVALLDIGFNLIAKNDFTMTKDHTPKLTITKIIDIIKQFKRNYHLKSADILGISIGAVGPLNREEGIILNPESFLATGWESVAIVRELQHEFGLHTILENGANTAALSEYYQSPALNQNILYCISGAGLRCGILANGEIVKNKQGDASSFGHMIIDMNGKTCICGHKGCLLSYISLRAISNMVKQRIDSGERSLMNQWIDDHNEEITLEKIIKAGRLNDDLVHQVMSETAYYFGIGIANMINLTHPEHVILDGKLIYEYPTFFEQVVQTAKDHVFHQKDTISFSKGLLKEDAVVVGAAIHLFNTLL